MWRYSVRKDSVQRDNAHRDSVRHLLQNSQKECWFFFTQPAVVNKLANKHHIFSPHHGEEACKQASHVVFGTACSVNSHLSPDNIQALARPQKADMSSGVFAICHTVSAIFTISLNPSA